MLHRRGIDSLESIHGLLKRLKIQALVITEKELWIGGGGGGGAGYQVVTQLTLSILTPLDPPQYLLLKNRIFFIQK
jgi:hypothetical protein